jgi:hypothetical protein
MWVGVNADAGAGMSAVQKCGTSSKRGRWPWEPPYIGNREVETDACLPAVVIRLMRGMENYKY